MKLKFSFLSLPTPLKKKKVQAVIWPANFYLKHYQHDNYLMGEKEK